MKKIIISSILFFVIVPLFAKTLWVDSNLYSSKGAFKVGELIMVNVRDISNLKFSVDSKSNSSINLSSSPDKNLTKFLPPVSFNKNMDNSGSIKYKGKNSLKFTIATTIQGRTKGGLLKVAGSRTYRISGVMTQVAVSGVVDTLSISGGEVDSNRVGNFTFSLIAGE